MREPQSTGGCLRRFAIFTLVIKAILTVTFAFTVEEGWRFASIVGLATGVFFGGIFAPIIPISKRMLTGQG